jgi:hypothetical protein
MINNVDNGGGVIGSNLKVTIVAAAAAISASRCARSRIESSMLASASQPRRCSSNRKWLALSGVSSRRHRKSRLFVSVAAAAMKAAWQKSSGEGGAHRRNQQ